MLLAILIKEKTPQRDSEEGIVESARFNTVKIRSDVASIYGKSESSVRHIIHMIVYCCNFTINYC